MNDETMQNLCAKFYEFVKDKPALDREGFQEVMKTLDLKVLHPLIVERLFKAFDKNGNNWVEYDEYVFGLNVLFWGSFDEKVRFGFSVYDFNDDGLVSREELTTMLYEVYELLFDKPADLDRLITTFVDLAIKHYDTDKDDALNFVEFEFAANTDQRIANFFTLGFATDSTEM